METRIEIFKDNKWINLLLNNTAKIKYNSVINKIGKTNNRQISHTNTFEIPKVWNNTFNLSLNDFNPIVLAKSLNSKYEARYYVNDKLLQAGFIVINNTNNNTIKLNFIDSSLDIVEKWGSQSHKDIILDTSLVKNIDYQLSIDAMMAFNMDPTGLVGQLQEIGTRGYTLATFPNSLNCIGDNFQKGVSGIRESDVFIPYQSRPAINARALFDLSCEAFGYTAEYDPSLDIERLNKTFYISENVNDGEEGADAFEEIVFTTTAVSNRYSMNYSELPGGIPPVNGIAEWVMQFDLSKSVKPEDISGFFLSGIGEVLDESSLPPPNNDDEYEIDNWRAVNSIFVPDLSNGNSGELKFEFSWLSPSGRGVIPIAVWENTNTSNPVVFQSLVATDISSGTTSFSFKVNKDFANNPPANAGSLIGIMVRISGQTSITFTNNGDVMDQKVTESFLPPSVLAFGDLDEYLSSTVDLTHAFSNEIFKEIIVGIMHQQGILMNIDGINKNIKYFTYGAYQNAKENGDYYDWSDLIIKNDLIIKDTDYGNDYAQLNLISLSDPYSGNVGKIKLENDLGLSKYKDFTKDEVEKFKDVINVSKIDNINTPYFEYEISGQSIVEQNATLGLLTQKNVDGLDNGTFTGLPHLVNVNYANIPKGVREWYKLVDNAIRVSPKFLLPIEIVRTLDLSKPVYISHLGGFYIIEEIAEYIDDVTPVTIKLIKLIDELKEDN